MTERIGQTDAEFSGDPDDNPSNPSANPTLGEVITARIDRRDLLIGLAGAAGMSMIPATWPSGPAKATAGGLSTLSFREISHGADTTHHVAEGYRADILMRWGDSMLPDAPAFESSKLSASAQAKQFGYNNDFIGYVPLPIGSRSSTRGLLCVNHEYTDAEIMWPGLTRANKKHLLDRAQVDVEMAAHGHSVIEFRHKDGRWRAVQDSPYNRRITAGDIVMRISGPAAGHARLRTNADPSGRRVIGTLNNCAGGVTPWGTVLIAEENFKLYFGGGGMSAREASSHKRFGIKPDPRHPWWKYHARFDIGREPNEPNRFGWLVEIDPYDPGSVPVKRTALGRFQHEGADVVVNPDGRVVCYSGDDQSFEYLYRFVSARRYDPDDRAANLDVLDDGTLCAARFNADGTLDWLPLVWGQGSLTPEEGFDSQAEVLIDARRAADRLGATKLDRPEDVEHNATTGRVYVMLTNNTRRRADDSDAARRTDAANPRPSNAYSQIVEMIPPMTGGGAADHAAERFRWDLFLLAGDPRKAAVGTRYHPETSRDGWFGSPDNCAFDDLGRMWIATDQGRNWGKTGTADGVWACDTAGTGRALTRMFFRAPIGAEVSGPRFTPDGETLFIAVQHPAADVAGGSTFENPATRWPDFKSGVPPRPSVVAITQDGGGKIGT